jgi:hypothetical protein
LALAVNLAMTEVPPAGLPITADMASTEAQTVDERLRQTLSLSFPRQTLEQAIELFARECGIVAEILGGDLQLEGITKNQSFGLSTTDLPASQVLEQILRQASPDGKLIYIVKPHPESGVATIYITTRGAAAQRGDPIPPELGENMAN